MLPASPWGVPRFAIPAGFRKLKELSNTREQAGPGVAIALKTRNATSDFFAYGTLRSIHPGIGQMSDAWTPIERSLPMRPQRV